MFFLILFINLDSQLENMKKTLATLILLLLISLITQGQITKGFWLIGGTGNFRTGKNELNFNRASTSLVLRPKAGYFVSNQFAVGVNAVYGFNRIKFDQNLIGSSHNAGIGPLVRYYFLPSGKRINLLAEATGSIFRNWSKNPRTPPLPAQRSSSTSYDYSFSAGVAFFLNSTVALEFLPGYYGSTPNSFSPNQFVINIGFQIHLEKEK